MESAHGRGELGLPDKPEHTRHKKLMRAERTSIASSELVSVEPSVLSSRQKERIRAFQNITRRVTDQQVRLDNHEKRMFLIYDTQGNTQQDDKGNEIGVVITQEMISTWRQTAFHMYEAFTNDPNMKQAADGHLQQLNTNKANETQRLNALWNATEGEVL